MKTQKLHQYEKESYTFGIFQKSTNKHMSKKNAFVLTIMLILCVPIFCDTKTLYKTWEAAQFRFKTNQKIRLSNLHVVPFGPAANSVQHKHTTMYFNNSCKK